MKKIVALTLALVLVLGIAATAFAATYPTVTLASKYKNKKVWQGDAFTFVFKLKSNNYYRLSDGTWRAEFATYIAKASNGIVYGYDDIYFTGNLSYKLKLTGDATWDMPTGKYNTFFSTFYKYGSYWYPYYMNYTTLTVR